MDGWLATHLPALDAEQDGEERAARAWRPPGKRARTSRLEARPPALRDARAVGFLIDDVQPVQREEAAGRARLAADDAFAVHLAAREGVRGGGSALPHLSVLQTAFGRHDLSGVRAHIGGAAAEASAAIGAAAYATGDDIAFASAPDLRQAAHEAAHVVQQRGGVSLAGGVGARGDAYERHADEVAELVVRGESAEAVLDRMAPAPAAASAAVQREEPDRMVPYSYAPPETTTATGTPEQLRGAPLADLFGLFVLRDARTIGPRITGFHRMTDGTTYSYEWASGEAGAAIVRGEIYSQLLGCTAAQATAHHAAVGSRGHTARIAELNAIIDQAAARTAAGHTETAPALLEQGTEGRTYTRRGDRRGTGESMGDRIHAATDVTSPTGTAVYAPVAGTVVFSGRIRGYGNIVTVVHEHMPAPYAGRRFQTAYAHLSQRLVEGGTLAAGQAIGLVGATRTDEEETVDADGEVHEHGSGGRVAGGMGAHLHFGLIELFRGAAPRAWGSSVEESYAANPRHIRPDDWLAALHTDIGARPNPPRETSEDDEGGGRRGARRRSDGAAVLDGDEALAAAHHGLRGAGEALPHLDRLQAAFGDHDLGGIGARTGGDAADAARAIGAAAYASGEQIAFAATPSLWLAAHETAHVIQQRLGDAPDGLGAAGDAQERHADAVADAVVRGESVASLFGEGTGVAAGRAVQRLDLDGNGIEDPVYEGTPPAEITRGDDDAGRLAGLSVADLFAVYAMPGRALGDRVTGFHTAPNGAIFSYEWVNGAAGTAALRGMIRNALRGATADQLTTHRTAIDALRGPPARKDELRAMLDAAALPPEGTEGAAATAPGALPPGATEEQVTAAVTHNSGLGMRIDWVRRLQQHLRSDGRMVSLTGDFDAETVTGVMWMQHDAGLAVNGRIDAATRQLLEGAWANLQSTLLGEHLDAVVLVPAAATGEARYNYYRNIITGAGGVFLDGPNQINMLGIRGAIVEEVGGQWQVSRSASAAEFAAARAAAGDPLPGIDAPAGTATTSLHFSGRTSRESGFDDAIITIRYTLDDGGSPVYHVREHRGSVDPQSHWSDTESDEGTAHLRDGTYRYRLGSHTTHYDRHARAVRDGFEHPEDMGIGAADTDASTSYDALNAVDNIEVWRDDAGDDDHFLTSEETAASDREIAERDARFVGRNSIGINIHSAPNSAPSSQGCQNVPVNAGYEEMIGEIRDSENASNIYYTLIDASRIAGELHVETSTQLQREADDAASLPGDPARTHAAAAHGVRDGGGALPHLEVIQRAFGHHDVGDVRAHVGGAAADASRAIGAAAYAYGDAVAFAGAPDLRQAAHEAAHVVQQRGGVRLDGGIGRSGDPYEQHADAVADLVVRGETAESLLDTMAHRGAGGGAAVQRLDSHDITADVMSATGVERTGALDARSERRVYERIAELEGRDPVAAGNELDRMTAGERADALEAAVRRFQTSEGEGTPDGARLIREIEADNAVDDPHNDEDLYETRPLAERMADFEVDAAHAGHAAPRAREHTDGHALLNDATMQALAEAWPQRFFGRLLDQTQAYNFLRLLVVGRGLPFNPAAVNVIGLRGFQGGEEHDNGEGEPVAAGVDPATRPGRRIFTGANRFDDVMYLVSLHDGEPRVQPTRATVDPGGESDLEFQVAADQQWDYIGYGGARSPKYDRAIYGLADGGTDVRRGTYWRNHPELVDGLPSPSGSTGAGGRIIRREHGEVQVDRGRSGQGVVSAVHSGGRGGDTGETTGGDSIGCSVVHGAWYARFNESLRRADHERTDEHAADRRERFTYSLIDPRTYTAREIQHFLDQVAPAAAEEEAPAAEAPRREPGMLEEPRRTIDYGTFIPPEAPPAALPDGGTTAPADVVHAAAAAGVRGAATALPHGDAIQASFGHHDVSRVRAHVGGAAAEASRAIGAAAYAYGDDVAFAGAPELRQAAHEAAHVVQQRGGVRLDGGVGRAGDPYEQHADAVAERVVRGESAEALLDTMAHRGAGGGPAVQRIDFDGDGRDDGAARSEARVVQLIEDVVAAIAANEVGGRAAPTESSMNTSAGVPASYASATQMTGPHAVQVLIGARGDSEGERAERRRYAAGYGLDGGELLEARSIMSAAQRIWDALVMDRAAVDTISAEDLEATHFTPDELQRLVRFGELRARVRAGAERFAELRELSRTWLTERAIAALAEVNALHAGEPSAPAEEPDAPAGEPAAPAEEPADDAAAAETAERAASDAAVERALDALAPGRRGVAAALRDPWRVPARPSAAQLNRRRSAITRARGRIGELAEWAGEAGVTDELFADAEFAALAEGLGIGRADVRVYINGGDFNKFAEDRNGWSRLALQRSTERNAAPGTEARTYDAALSAVASDHGGRGLSRLEYQLWLRAYIDDHPTATDQTIVRAAAEHNSHDPDYPDNIWGRYQTIVRGRAPAGGTGGTGG